MSGLLRLINRRSRLWVCLALGVSLVLLGPLAAAVAVQLGDGSTMFVSPPRLVSFETTQNQAGRRNATYYVTVNLLPDADEPLKTLAVDLIEGRFPRLNYRLNDLEVFVGTRRDRGADLAIAQADYNDDTQTLTIELLEPAAPGQLLTFALKPIRNPTEGVYLFEVSAAPAGEQPVWQRAGTGRLHIYRDVYPLFH